MARRRKPRRGVLMLVILSILVLFLLVGITFIVVAGSYKRGAVAHAKHARAAVEPKKSLVEAWRVLMVGARSNGIRTGFDIPNGASYSTESILSDMYGGSAFKGTIANAGVSGGGQFIDVQCSNLPNNNANMDGNFAGRVFTVKTGHYAGLSSRVVFSQGGSTALRIEMLKDPHGHEIEIAELTTDHDGQPVEFLLNERPFDDTGDSEDYDAPGPLNPFLAYWPTDLIAENNTLTSEHLIPSFHRPALIRSVTGSSPSDYEGVILRPMPWDHPYFTGSNPAFTQPDPENIDNAAAVQAAINGPWDVDNDGDGVPDSIWIDLGTPVRQAKDGTFYKELFAVLCLDMDGRVNINYHGASYHSMPEYTNAAPPPSGGSFAGGLGSVTNRRGLGFGPADVPLSPVLGSTDASSLISLRYGSDGVPGMVGDDPLSGVNNNGLPDDYFGTSESAGWKWRGYGSPGDLLGVGFYGLDPDGLPEPVYMWNSHINNEDPYEVRAGVDRLFTAAELERVLRPYDSDVWMLPNRITNNTATAFNDSNGPFTRQRVTTHSSHYPGFAEFPQGFRNNPTAMQTILPTEMLLGEKMNLNRPLGNGRDDDGDRTVDEPEEAAAETAAFTQATAPSDFKGTPPNYANCADLNAPAPTDDAATAHLLARQIYARHLYCLLRAASGGSSTSSRRMAQWAVNAVDFRDPDGIMTVFYYDPDPFDGNWNPSQVVIGCESPDLLITEAKAFHDKRLTDYGGEEKSPPDGNTGKRWSRNQRTENGNTIKEWVEDDDDLDQARIPEGSLFLELFCPRGRYFNNPRPPRELYVVDESNQKVSLDLGRVATLADGTPDENSPVWRIAITAPHNGTTIHGLFDGATPSTTELLPSRSNPDVIALDDTGTQSIAIERVIWFHKPSSAPTSATVPVYYNRFNESQYGASTAGYGTSVLCEAGTHAIVGPRPVTYLGNGQKTVDPNSGDETITVSEQRIEIYPQNLQVYGTNTPTTSKSVSLGIVAGAALPGGWSAPSSDWSNYGIGVSISEPLPTGANYYPQPSIAPVTQSGAAYKTPSGGTFTKVDMYDRDSNSKGIPLDSPLDEGSGRPLNREDWGTTGTYPNVCTAVLQRLADPTQPHQPTFDPSAPHLWNPYVSVDWAAIDLTVFNGEDEFENHVWTTPDDSSTGYPDPDGSTDTEGFGDLPDGDWDPNDGGENVLLVSRRRGDSTDARRPAPLWNPVTDEPSDGNTSEPAYEDGGNIFDAQLDHSFGILNEELKDEKPFPWIVWHDRPFANPYELMLVPASGPSRLGYEATLRRPLTDTSGGATANDLGRPFGHLLNFLSEDTGHYRLFDFVQTPSRYVEDQVWYHPTNFANSANAGAQFLRPPYNRRSTFRESGRVNINTISDAVVLQAVTRLTLTEAQELFRRIEKSRAGYDYQRTTAGRFDNSANSRFSRPFRGGYGRVVDDTILRNDTVLATSGGTELPLLLYPTGSVNSTNSNDKQYNDYDRKRLFLLRRHSEGWQHLQYALECLCHLDHDGAIRMPASVQRCRRLPTRVLPFPR
jgi:hypothetical protein